MRGVGNTLYGLPTVNVPAGAATAMKEKATEKPGIMVRVPVLQKKKDVVIAENEEIFRSMCPALDSCA